MKIFTTICKYNHYLNPFVYLLYVSIFSHENIHLLLYFIRNNYSYNNQNKYITNVIIPNTETNNVTKSEINSEPIKLVVEIPDIVENKMEKQDDTPPIDIHNDIHNDDDNSIDKNDYDYITISPEKCIIQKYFSKKWLKKFFCK